MAVLALASACGPGEPTQEPEQERSTGDDDTSTGATTGSSSTTGDPSDTTLSESDSSSSTSGADETSRGSSSSSSTGDGACEIGGAERCEQPGYGGDGECDPYQQDCPAGEKCLPFDPDATGVWDSTRCTPIVDDAAGLDEPCTMTAGSAVGGEDTCDIGLVCWDLVGDQGRCAEMCGCGNASPTCETEQTVCLVANGGAVGVCRPTCVPTDADACGANQVCVLTPPGIFQCLNALDDAGLGEPYDASNGCAAGLQCTTSAACDGPCCLAYCDVDDPAGCDGTCEPVFPGGAPHECYDAVGLCEGG